MSGKINRLIKGSEHVQADMEVVSAMHESGQKGQPHAGQGNLQYS